MKTQDEQLEILFRDMQGIILWRDQLHRRPVLVPRLPYSAGCTRPGFADDVQRAVGIGQ